MLSFDEALYLVLQNVKDFGAEEVDILQSAGRILAQNVVADRDFPPYNRVMMDGIAINSAEYYNGIRTFKVESILAAGSPQLILANNQNCIEVMTGAVLPLNTDTVIPYEQCEIIGGVATIDVERVSAMQNVHLQATDSKEDDLLVEKWMKITPAIIGILASVGLSKVMVLSLPKIAICSTGDELVDINEQPETHQVRRSNVYMLAAALLSEGIVAKTIHLRDDPDLMVDEITSLIKTNDVIMFSGAVSKGKFDYLPTVLNKLGMQQIFHKVAQKPGKPFLLGKFSNDALVFGFPGNPVSTFVCYHQFFKRWMRQCMKYKQQSSFAKLTDEINFKPALSYHVLGKIHNDNGGLFITPVSGSGSGDLITLTQADGIITLSPDKNHFNAGEIFELNFLN